MAGDKAEQVDKDRIVLVSQATGWDSVVTVGSSWGHGMENGSEKDTIR